MDNAACDGRKVREIMEVFYKKGDKYHGVDKNITVYISLLFLSYHEEITFDEVVMGAKAQGFV